jgi:hypothetical protein
MVKKPEEKLPQRRFRIGNVTASVWKNTSDRGVDFYSVTLQKSYKDDKGEWQNTESLNHSDIVCAMRVLEYAERYIIGVV